MLGRRKKEDENGNEVDIRKKKVFRLYQVIQIIGRSLGEPVRTPREYMSIFEMDPPGLITSIRKEKGGYMGGKSFSNERKRERKEGSSEKEL